MREVCESLFKGILVVIQKCLVVHYKKTGLFQLMFESKNGQTQTFFIKIVFVHI